MKVIGETGQGYILTATSSEVAQLMGFDSPYDRGFRAPVVGHDLPVTSIHNAAKNVSEWMQRHVNAAKQANAALETAILEVERAMGVSKS